MKTLQEISNTFHAEYHNQEDRINAIKAQAERIRAAAMRYQRLAAQKMGEYNKTCVKLNSTRDVHWTDSLLLPLLMEVEERTGWEFDRKGDLRTFGLRCECPVYINGEGKDQYGYPNTKAGITFTPELHSDDDGYHSWELYFDTGEKSGANYHPDSIGALNGFNNKRAKVESVEQIIDFLQRQINKVA